MLSFYIVDTNPQWLIRRDRTVLIAGSQQFIECIFSLPESWQGLYITASFKNDELESSVVEIQNEVPVKVPGIVLGAVGTLDIALLGVMTSTIKVTTNAVGVVIRSAGITSGLLPAPTEDIVDPYAQYVELVNEVNTNVTARQDAIENVFDTVINESVSNNPASAETVMARLGEDTLPIKIGKIDFKLDEVSNKVDVSELTPIIYNKGSVSIIGKGTDVTGSILDYVDSIENGTVNDAVLEGLTIANELVNGDFSDGINGYDTSDLNGSFFNDSSTGALVATDDLNLIYQEKEGSIADKIFYSAKIKRNSGTGAILLALPYGQATGSLSIAMLSEGAFDVQLIGDWYQYSSIATLNNAGYRIAFGRYGRQTYSLNIDNIFAINMTKYGIEDYTEEQMLDLIHQGYFDGMKSTLGTQRIKNVGKNLFDKDFIVGFVNITNNNFDTSASSAISSVAEVEGGKSYTASTNGNRSILGFFANYPVAFEPLLSSYINTGIAPANANYAAYFCNSDNGLYPSEVQIEQNDTPTDYEPYTEDSTYIETDDELRSLPNGVRDNVDVATGVLTRRVVKYTLLEDDVLSEFVGSNNTWYLLDQLPDMASIYIGGAETGGVCTKDYIEVATDDRDVIGKRGYYINSDSNIRIIFPNGTYENLAEAKADLAGTIIHYQLAEPEITNLPNITPIQAFKNGTTYIDPYIKDSFTYNYGITLPYVCSQLDKVVDIEGNEVETILSADGATVTITNGINGNGYIVYAPIKTDLNTIPQSSFSFPSNTKAQIESNNKGLIKLEDDILNTQDHMQLGDISLSIGISKAEIKINNNAKKIKGNTTISTYTRVPAITFIDDDAREEVYSVLKPLFEARDIPCCTAIITDDIDAEIDSLNSAQISELFKLGWEIMGHSKTHSAITNMSIDDLELEIGSGCFDKLSNMGIDVYGFVTPNDESNETSRAITTKYYDYSFTGQGMNDETLIDTMNIKRIAFGNFTDYNPTINGNSEKNTLNYYKECVDYARTNNTWVIFMSHCYLQDEAQTVILGQLLDYIKTTEAQILTAYDAYKIHGNAYFAGDINEGNYVAVSKNKELFVGGLDLRMKHVKLSVPEINIPAGSNVQENITLIGVDSGKTLISGNPSYGLGYGTGLMYNVVVALDDTITIQVFNLSTSAQTISSRYWFFSYIKECD